MKEKRVGGFTLLEIILVVVLVGIVATMVKQRYDSVDVLRALALIGMVICHYPIFLSSGQGHGLDGKTTIAHPGNMP